MSRFRALTTSALLVCCFFTLGFDACGDGPSGEESCDDNGLLAYAYEVRQGYINEFPYGSRWEITLERIDHSPADEGSDDGETYQIGAQRRFYRSVGAFELPPPPPPPTCADMELLWQVLGEDAWPTVDLDYLVSTEWLIEVRLRGVHGSWVDRSSYSGPNESGETTACPPATFNHTDKIVVVTDSEGMSITGWELLSAEEDPRIAWDRAWNADGRLFLERSFSCDFDYRPPTWSDSVPIRSGTIFQEHIFDDIAYYHDELVTLVNILSCDYPGYSCVYDEDCQDGIECTRDLCVEGTCQFPNDDTIVPAAASEGCAECVDGRVEHCDCSTDADCDDGNVCTRNYCLDGICFRDANDAVTPPAENGACRVCSGGESLPCPCTTNDQCDDGRVCTHDYCSGDRCRNRADNLIIPPQDPGDCRRCINGEVVSSQREQQTNCSELLQKTIDTCSSMGLTNWRVDYAEADSSGNVTQTTYCSGGRRDAACADEGPQDEDECPSSCNDGGTPYVQNEFSDRSCETGSSNAFEMICSVICSGCKE